MQSSILYDPNRRPLYRATYTASTNGTVATSTGANTVTSIGYLFHPSASALRVEIIKIGLSWGGNAGNNDLSFRAARITAENGTPGGTSQTINAFDQDDTPSTMTLRSGATGTPVRAAGDYFCVAAIGGSADQRQILMFDAGIYGKPIVLRSGQAEGLEIRLLERLI